MAIDIHVLQDLGLNQKYTQNKLLDFILYDDAVKTLMPSDYSITATSNQCRNGLFSKTECNAAEDCNRVSHAVRVHRGYYFLSMRLYMKGYTNRLVKTQVSVSWTYLHGGNCFPDIVLSVGS